MTKGSHADVSVVIPCYRCAGTVERAVSSVYAQTVRPAEVILVDDCSGDETLGCLYALQERYPNGWVKVIEQGSNGGPGEARNAGWDSSSQPYLAFLDADDTWHPQKIEIQHSWMSQHPRVVLSGHITEKVREHDNSKTQKRFGVNEGLFKRVTRKQLLVTNCFSTPSVMVRRDLPTRFAQGKYQSEDYLLWLRIACAGHVLVLCDLPLGYIHKAPYGEGGLSAQLWAMEKGELDTYGRLVSSGCVSWGQYALLCGWSISRYLRRWILVRLRG